MKRFILLFALLCSHLIWAKEISLNGEWSFVMDPLKMGETYSWHIKSPHIKRPYNVQVPHCWTTSPNFKNYTGAAWYWKQIEPVNKAKYYTIHFDAVFYDCTIWVNGKLAGQHEGGYTPFEFEISDLLSSTEKNTITVRVDNSWSTSTVPGARDCEDPSCQVYPWLNYGGITRNVTLNEYDAIHMGRTVLNPTSDGKLETWDFSFYQEIFNNSEKDQTFEFNLKIIDPVNDSIVGKYHEKGITIHDHAITDVESDIKIKKPKLWEPTTPHLYRVEIEIKGKHLYHKKILNTGFRLFEIVEGKILINGKSFRLGGCNRPMDHPKTGSMDPDEILFEDLRLAKEAGMIFHRISHYPTTTSLLDWADKNGMIIIGEAANWQFTEHMMDDEKMRAKFKSQFTEMVARDINHPSIMAWSIGNEFYSKTPSGFRWVKEMAEYSKEIDPDRFVTFSSMFLYENQIQHPEDEASIFVDFISANLYNRIPNSVENIQKIYPSKPLFISEFGNRVDVKGGSEGNQVKYFDQNLNASKIYSNLIGASVWSLQDYKSMYPRTGVDGYRRWGVIDENRKKRKGYSALKNQFNIISYDTEDGNVILTNGRFFGSIDLDDVIISQNNEEILSLSLWQQGKPHPIGEVSGTIEVYSEGFLIQRIHVK